MAERRRRERYQPEPDYADQGERYAEDYEDGYGPDYGPAYEYDDGYGDGYDYDGYGGPAAYDNWSEPPRRGAGALLCYLGDHNLTLFLLLVLLPPLGVALLWARRRFRRRGRVLLTAMTLIWVAALSLLLVRPLQDRRVVPADTANIPQTADMGQTNPVVVSDEELGDAIGVYVTETGPFYHQLNDCRALSTTEEITRIGQNEALDSGRMACPYCLGGQYTDGLWDLKFVNTDSQDQSGLIVYCSATNASFHTDAQCPALNGGLGVSMLDAILMGKVFCENCCPEASREVFCTMDGSYYHYDGECSGMRDPSLVTLPEALVLGKTRCPICIKNSTGTALETTDANSDATYYVYATRNGTYYHIKKNCSGMKNAKKVSLKQMLAARRPACPKCCPNVEMIVYTERGNPYYHSTSTCSDMKEPVQGTLVEALANGLSRCPTCWTTAS